jgi:dihydrolipoamide dehydrogenase
MNTEKSNHFDLIIIGSGPAGYTAAIRAAQLNMKVACIEKNQTLGGTCLNVGCIPSKTLLHISKEYEYAKNHFAEIGIETSVKADIEKMIQRKSKVVSELCKGIEGLFAKNKITKISGTAKIIDKSTIEVENQKYTTKNILIATGSEITTIPNVEIDEKFIISSAAALDLKIVPKKMTIIGGGYIGLELGSVWRRLGSEVTIVEYADRIVPALDKEVGDALFKILSKQGMKFKLSTKVENAQVNEKNKPVVVVSTKEGEKESIESDIVLVSVGRKPHTKNLWSEENVGIRTDKIGRIEVDNHYKTSVDGIYAVGDVIFGPMLAHKAEEEAIAAVEMMNNIAGHVNYSTIPSVIYTSPEVSSVGITEEEAKDRGINYKIGKFPFLANSKARAQGNTDGFVKIISDAKTDKVLGCHIIGLDAGNLIQEVVVLMEFSGSAEDLARICHPHPTLSEAVREACLNVDKRAINF